MKARANVAKNSSHVIGINTGSNYHRPGPMDARSTSQFGDEMIDRDFMKNNDDDSFDEEIVGTVRHEFHDYT
jgi:hypothetical protein